ncbi:MAG: hypothetical protein H6748_19250 [Spirochaetaceae bacterium]|nr:hypothetical protein [Myxococcales bacterium]MCB9726193.1 hypothetical protein [Spirochaetaceae bacterium]
MARRGNRGRRTTGLVAGSALLLAGLALYLLLRGGGVDEPQRPTSSGSVDAPALDEHDERSREAMRELLREADRTD